MNNEHRPDRSDRESRAHFLHPVLALALLASFGAGCSEEFQECVDDWNECRLPCPSEEEEAAILAAAATTRSECLDRCGPITDPHTNPQCILGCLEDYDDATQLIGCSDACDAAFLQCVEDIQPAPALPPVPLARRIGSGLYEIDRRALGGLLSSPIGALQKAEFVPLSIDAGIGFVLLRAAPDSVIAQLGAEKGDVLLRIAGEPLSADSLQAALRTLSSGGQVSATVRRGGATVDLTYTLR